MKALVSLVLAVALIGGIYLATTSGCGARAEVAGDKIMKLIDSRLGDLDVKLKKVQKTMTGLEKQIASNREGKIRAEVRLEGFDKNIATVESKIARTKKALGVLNPHLSASGDVEINGKTMSVDRIKEMANELLNDHETQSSKLGSLKATRRQYDQAYQAVSKNYEVSTQQMGEMKKMVEMIKGKKEALDDMKGAQSILSETGSVSDKFSSLQKEVEDLMLGVETGLRLETEKIKERETSINSSNSTADEILSDMGTADDTQDRINAILGEDGN